MEAARMTSASLRVGQFNVLCPAYGLKWGEREACLDWVSNEDHGGSNWDLRWPAILRCLRTCAWSVLALEELEESVRPSIEQGLESIGLQLICFDHPGREDGIGIAFAARHRLQTLSPW